MSILVAYKNDFARRGWGEPSKLEPMPEPAEETRARETKNRIFVEDEIQRITDAAYRIDGGIGAPGWLKQLLGGWRNADDLRRSMIKLDDLRLQCGRTDTKPGKIKDEEMYPILSVHFAWLDQRQLLTDRNLALWNEDVPGGGYIRAKILMEACGFWCRGWETRYHLHYDGPEKTPPHNAPRRTGMAVKFKCCGNVAQTLSWAGTGLRSWDQNYARLSDKAHARFTLKHLPTFMYEDYDDAYREMLLPVGHKLDAVPKHVTEAQRNAVKLAARA